MVQVSPGSLTLRPQNQRPPWSSPPHFATSGAQIPALRVRGPAASRQGLAKVGGGLPPTLYAAARGLSDPEQAPAPSPTGWWARALSESPPPDAARRAVTAPPLLTAHDFGCGGPPGHSSLGVVSALVSGFGPRRPLPMRSGRLRAGSASDHVARVPACVAPPPDGGHHWRPCARAPAGLGLWEPLRAHGGLSISFLSTCPSSVSSSGGFLDSCVGPGPPGARWGRSGPQPKEHRPGVPSPSGLPA